MGSVTFLTNIDRDELEAKIAEGESGLPDFPDAPSNLMLITDADGNAVWEDRTHYSYDGYGEIIPETSFTSESISYAGTININTPATLENGKMYTVKYLGNEYECAAYVTQAKPILESFGLTVDETVMCALLGNLGILNPQLASSEPFTLMVTQGTDVMPGYDIYGFLLPSDAQVSSGSYAVYGMAKRYVTIPEEYLPDSIKIPYIDLAAAGFPSVTVNDSGDTGTAQTQKIDGMSAICDLGAKRGALRVRFNITGEITDPIDGDIQQYTDSPRTLIVHMDDSIRGHCVFMSGIFYFYFDNGDNVAVRFKRINYL